MRILRRTPSARCRASATVDLSFLTLLFSVLRGARLMQWLRDLAEHTRRWMGWSVGSRPTPVARSAATHQHSEELFDHLSVVQRIEQVEDYHRIKMSGRVGK